MTAATFTGRSGYVLGVSQKQPMPNALIVLGFPAFRSGLQIREDRFKSCPRLQSLPTPRVDQPYQSRARHHRPVIRRIRQGCRMTGARRPRPAANGVTAGLGRVDASCP